MSNTRKCREFGISYTLVQTEHELADIIDRAGIPDEFRADITGAFVLVGDGDYAEIWLTDESPFYDFDVNYMTPNYWR